MTKRIDGEVYRKMKGHAGKVWWVRMHPEEVRELHLYNAALVVVPLLMLLAWSLAAGLLG